MKDKILDIHPTIGIITCKDLIDDLSLVLIDYKELQDILIGILKHQNWDNETISTLFNYNIDNRLNCIINLLKGLL